MRRVFQDAVSCATIQWEDTSVLAWQDTHFWRMAGIVLVKMHVATSCCLIVLVSSIITSMLNEHVPVFLQAEGE